MVEKSNPPLEIDRGLDRLAVSVRRRAPADAALLLEDEAPESIAYVLARLPPAFSMRVIDRLPEHLLFDTLHEVHPLAEQWAINEGYEEGSVGRIMEPASGVFSASSSAATAIEALRDAPERDSITYIYATDPEGHLLGVVTMRDLLFCALDVTLEEIMLIRPFRLAASADRSVALEAAQTRHYPVYPVCDDADRLVGVVHGYALAEERTLVLAAHSGQMVGVEAQERLATPWHRSFRYRHPWLQFNLLTAFSAAFVVGMFEATISQVVALAAFLPVLAGQSGNTGCQSLALTLRGLTLDEYPSTTFRALIRKESILGLVNGLLVGVTAGVGMYFYAHITGAAQPLWLAGVVLVAMVLACTASGIAGVVVPLALRRLGADPVTASTIFLTTATDVV
ncbi:MAG: magnesium transporter, partial [Gammaproteobacteria bacterium]